MALRSNYVTSLVEFSLAGVQGILLFRYLLQLSKRCYAQDSNRSSRSTRGEDSSVPSNPRALPKQTNSPKQSGFLADIDTFSIEFLDL